MLSVDAEPIFASLTNQGIFVNPPRRHQLAKDDLIHVLIE
jgi:hypothetical protein